MRLRAIELDQFRKFDRPVRLDGLGPGLNVLCGPNEHGKSTILAALRAVLFEKHGARSEAIRGYQHHRGNTAPSVALEFEHAGAAHRIEKRFLSRASARLTSAGIAYDGDAAEEGLARLLGVSAPTRAARDAASQTASIWGALLVSQGDSFAQARLGDGARSTLSDCLETELGQVSGGAIIGRLLKQVQASLAQLLDGNGKPRDRYKTAIQEQEAAETAIATLEQRRHALDGDLAAALEARQSLLREADPTRAEQTNDALLAARRHRDTVLSHRDRLAQAEFATRLAGARHDDAGAEHARRTQRAEALARARQSLAALLDAEAEATARVETARFDLAGRRAAYDEAGRRQDAAEHAVRRAADHLSAAGQAAARDEARIRLNQAEAEQLRIEALTAVLSRHRLDEAGLRALQQAELAHGRNQAALQAQATTLELALDVPARLLVEGEPPAPLVPGPIRLTLTRPTELELPGIGRLRILPASRDQEMLHAAAQETARALRSRLDAAGCTDLAEAEHLLSERRALATALDQAARLLAATLAPHAAIDPLRRHLSELDAALAEFLSRLDLDQPPDQAAAAAARDAAVHSETQNRDLFLAARDALLAPDGARELAEATLRQAEFDRRSRAIDCDRLSSEQSIASQTESDDVLADRLRHAAESLSQRQLALSALQAAAPDDTLDMAEATIQRLEQIQSNRRARIAALREQIAGLDSRIAREEGVGLDEQIEAARRRRDAAARDHAHHCREAAILTLLRDTLAQADREARERYLAPLMTRLSPYLTALFPRARLSLGDDFRITGLSRLDGRRLDGRTGCLDGDPDSESFDCLSLGTREQIAILARLAFADMLLATGRPAFLVLDDALAFADPARMDRMFDILGDAARRMQILVLTCREDVASGLGGTRLALREALQPA